MHRGALVGALGLGAAALLGPADAAAQPTKRDVPLRTPGGTASARPLTGPGGVLRTPPGGGAAVTGPGGGQPAGPSDGPSAGPSGPSAGPSAGPAAGPAGGAPAAKTDIAQPPDNAHKPPKPGTLVNVNMADVDLQQLVETIANFTGRRFIFGGKVRPIKATIISPKPVTTAEAYEAFLSVLEANGITVVPHGPYLKLVETQGVNSETTPVLGTGTPVPDGDRFVTRLYRVRHIDAAEVSNVLGKFKSRDGDITVYPPGNLLIITDTGAQIMRMLRIVEELDAGGVGEQIWMQPIHYLAAADLAASLEGLLDIGQGSRARIVAEERNNLLVIVATESDYLRLLEIIKRIDVPASGQGGIHVLPLQHAQCAELSQTLSNILSGASGGAPAASPVRGRSSRGGHSAGSNPSASGDGGVFEGEVRVTCDEATNALLVTSSLRDYAQLRTVIDRLDQPRRQVFIEAVIMDVNVDHTVDLGLGLHGGATASLGGSGDTVFYGGTNPAASLAGVPGNLEALAFGVRGPNLPGTSQLLGTGVSIPGFGVVMHALAHSGDSNVLATPHVLATDNIAAEISIGQNIPLQTNIGGGNLGQLAGLAGGAAGSTSTAAAGLSGLANMFSGSFGFQAPRQDVGIKLKITPHINDSDQVRMEISEEFSDAGSPTGALGAVPINKRTADTTIIVRDQQTVVIGGLVREGQLNGITKIPVLGDIPVLGLLFRQTNKQTQKTNLLLVLTPHIVREQNDLRRIFERKMQERQEFLDRYFVFDDTLPWEPLPDYSRANGLVEHIRQSQLAVAAHERLAAELRPEGQKEHVPVKPVALPSFGAGSQGKPSGGDSGRGDRLPRPTPTPAVTPPTPSPVITPPVRRRPEFRVPGGTIEQPDRYRIE